MLDVLAHVLTGMAWHRQDSSEDQDGVMRWEVEQDSSGGGLMTMAWTPVGEAEQVRQWRLTPVGGLPSAPLVVSQGSQIEPTSSQPTNPNTSQTGTASKGTLADVGLGIPVRLPI